MTAEAELRDRLALDRTLLANERTLLAYVRTSLALVGGGVGLLQFVATPAVLLPGWGLVAAGVLILPVGVRRFREVRRHLHRQLPPGAPP